jgi:hypothetical protein
VRRHRLLFVQDWNFRAPDWCERHRDTIRPYFRPFERHLAAARALVEPARAGGRFVVGVHVRRTDYARFKGGRWFYSLEQYRGFLERARRVFGDRDVAFLVCSDEALPREPFAGLEAHFGGRDGLEDLYALAGCDALLGPPSTYGRWASWWGGVPRYTIFDSERPFDAASFVVDTTLSPRPPLPATGAVG